MYVWSSQRKNKKKCKFCYKKSSKVLLVDSLIEIVHVTSVWWSVSCHVCKQECHSHPWFQPSKCEGPPKGEQWEVVGEMWKWRMLTPESWDAYERNEFSEPIFPYLERAKFLNLRYLLFLTIIFDVQTICLLCCKLLYNLTPSPASSEQFLRAPWDAASQAWNPKNFPPKKTTLNFQGFKYIQVYL